MESDYSFSSSAYSDRKSMSIEPMDLAQQRLIELEELVHQLMEENEQLKEQMGSQTRSPQQVLNEFEYFLNQMPIRGNQFMSGKIDARMLRNNPKITIKFAAAFAEPPEVFVFKFSATKDSYKLTMRSNNITVDGFTADFNTDAFDDISTVIWIAYLPLRVNRRYDEIVRFLNGPQAGDTRRVEDKVKRFLREKNAVKEEGKDGKTILHHLIAFGNETFVKEAIERGADVNALDNLRYSPLHVALSQQEINVEIVDAILNKNPDLLVTNESMRSPLHYLCRNPKLDKSQYMAILYRLMNDPKATEMCQLISKTGESPLSMVFTASMNEEAIKLLCDNGANVNQKTNKGSFPLYEAIRKKKIKIVELLLKNGADLDMEYNGTPVIKLAEETGQLSELMSLIEDRYAMKMLSQEEIEAMQTKFDTPKKPIVETWTKNVSSSKVILVDQEKLPDYHVENFFTSCTHKHDVLMNKNYHDASLPIKFYGQYIKPYPNNSYAITKTDEKSNTKEVIVVTIKSDMNDRKYIVWTKRETIRATALPGTTDIQILKQYGYKANKAVPLPQDNIEQQIDRFENYFISDKYKFGVLYAAKGQTTEMEMFNNKEGSVHFEKFLELLGTKTELQGFDGFAGGLDVKHDGLTGKYTYTKKFSAGEKISIMYHVSTYLPWSETNTQQLDRKRHIGNDIVVLIFKEYEGTPELLDLSSFRSQFNHCFIVVGYDLTQFDSDNPKYSVNVMCKRDIPPIAPFITTDQYEFGGLFSDFLVSKLINAENASKESAQFRTKNVMIRGRLLEGMVSDSSN